MDVYLVGGAVRDEALGIEPRERDWCVVGATPEEMKSLGYRQVGKDFPVFLHPETGEEYALARTERKTGPGYRGFEFCTSPDVSIEDDLRRRDLTINAMARDARGTLLDPFGGVRDLEAGLLRHVSAAFIEDPVRILRIAKFAARFAHRTFRVADETMQLMRKMVADGEVDALVPQRVWKETEAALAGADPATYFTILRDCHALAVVFPEIDALFGVPQPEKWHPEIDCGVHTLMVVDQAARLTPEVDIRFAALVHDLGKATTPPAVLPGHRGHERRSIRLIKALTDRIPVPATCRELALLVAEFHGHCHRALQLRSATILRVLERIDAFRRPERFRKFLVACEADARGRTGFEEQPYPQADYLQGAMAAAAAITAKEIMEDGMTGPQIGEAVRRRRLQAIAAWRGDAAPLRTSSSGEADTAGETSVPFRK